MEKTFPEKVNLEPELLYNVLLSLNSFPNSKSTELKFKIFTTHIFRLDPIDPEPLIFNLESLTN